MAESYTDIPHNMSEITPYVIVNEAEIVAEILRKDNCYFYDTCSFRRHSNLQNEEAEYLLKYIKNQNGIIIITRCILMELASLSGILNHEYVDYIKRIKEFGISVLIVYEEDLFSVMEIAFSTNATINEYLCWAVRSVKGPASKITDTLKQNSRIYDEIIKGRNLDNRGVYSRFFKAVRENKESGDNLGEELLAVCLHILSYLPGEEDGKFCVITDDKEAAGKIDNLFKQTKKQHSGKAVIIFSTPKLVQVLYRENILVLREHVKALLSVGTEGNIKVLGTLISDIRNRDISLCSEDLTDLIMKPNGINITF